MIARDKTQLYAIFHLNLAFSSIEEDQHKAVIERCYWPLLKLIENHAIPLAIELSVYTLERIAKLDTTWVDTLRSLTEQGRCEVLACGDSQIIGPLVPAKVNQKNLELGLNGYKKTLSLTPSIAYVNEQAISASVLDLYIDAGFKAVVIEWDNPYSHNPDWKKDTVFSPQKLLAASGRSIPVIWNHAVAFQKLQRYAHGEYTQDDYLDYLSNAIPEGANCFSIYGNDAEIFNFRPGRFKTEGKLEADEWQRLSSLFSNLSKHKTYTWASPSEIVSADIKSNALQFTNAAFPISVKKQAKYNITRWAVSGRDDLRLNTECHREYKRIGSSDENKTWKNLCRAWSSDVRTHLTERRFQTIVKPEAEFNSEAINWENAKTDIRAAHIEHDAERQRLYITSDKIRLSLNIYRGLSIESLAFVEHNFEPVIGSLSHGHFDHIRYAADFYSAHTVIERYQQRDRITDLNKATFRIGEIHNKLVIHGAVPSELGTINKYYIIDGENLRCRYEFEFNERPVSAFRLGYLTLLNCQNRPWYSAHLGGNQLEYFEANSDFDHGAPVSALISANSAISATEGLCYFGNTQHGIKLNWDTSRCAPVAMASSKVIRSQYLNRFWFSLVEVDDTLKAGGHILPLEFSVNAAFRNDAKQ